MPASRSARATTLAPRSCPSSPGLATTIRSGTATSLHGVTSTRVGRQSAAGDVAKGPIGGRAALRAGHPISPRDGTDSGAYRDCTTSPFGVVRHAGRALRNSAVTGTTGIPEGAGDRLEDEEGS